MTFVIQEPNAAISNALNKFRKSFALNQFNISPHANERMVERHIDLEEIIETVTVGQISRGFSITNYIGGKYYHKDVCVIVYAPFGDHFAAPTVVTLYRDGDSDDFDEKYLPDLPAKVVDLQQRLEQALKKPNLDSLSTEELENYLRDRKDRAAWEAREIQVRRERELTERQEDLLRAITKMQRELELVERELSEI